jgi:hypothetical protein
MIRLFCAALFYIISMTTLSGCGLLPTDRPPRDGRGHYPDTSQASWHRLLFGTRWIDEGPPVADWNEFRQGDSSPKAE